MYKGVTTRSGEWATKPGCDTADTDDHARYGGRAASRPPFPRVAYAVGSASKGLLYHASLGSRETKTRP